MNTRRDMQVLRKRMLLLKAQLQRAELAQHFEEMCEAAQPKRLLRGLLPSFGKRRDQRTGESEGTAGSLQSTLTTALSWFKRHPVAGSFVSLLATRFLSRGKTSASAKTMKWSILSTLGWAATRWWLKSKIKQYFR